jgi:hypothetical protein
MKPTLSPAIAGLLLLSLLFTAIAINFDLSAQCLPTSAQINGPTTVAVGSQIDYTFSPPEYPDPIATTWSISGGMPFIRVPASNYITVLWNAPGSYTITVTPSPGCTPVTRSVTVVNQSPINGPVLTYPQTACYGSNSTITAAPTPGMTVKWNYALEGAVSGPTFIENGNTLNANWNSAPSNNVRIRISATYNNGSYSRASIIYIQRH